MSIPSNDRQGDSGVAVVLEPDAARLGELAFEMNHRGYLTFPFQHPDGAEEHVRILPHLDVLLLGRSLAAEAIARLLAVMESLWPAARVVVLTDDEAPHNHATNVRMLHRSIRRSEMKAFFDALREPPEGPPGRG